MHSPQAIAALSLPVPIPMLEQVYTAVSEDRESLLTPCSPQAKPYDPWASVAPASPNNDLIVNKINCRPAPNSIRLPIVKTREGEDELLVEAARVHERSDERFPKNSELMHRVPEDFRPPDVANVLHQWLGQEAISSEDSSIFLCSPESTVALAPLTPTLTLVDPPPAYSRLHTSLELEPRRKKPPDKEAGSRRLPYIVNERLRTSVVKHPPSHGTVLMLPNIPSTRQGWAETHCLPNVELAWRARSKPPDTLGEIRQ